MHEKRVVKLEHGWARVLALKQEDVSAQEEFYLLLSSSSSGVERYVEWSNMRLLAYVLCCRDEESPTN
jgi:hypothetical protein